MRAAAPTGASAAPLTGSAQHLQPGLLRAVALTAWLGQAFAFYSMRQDDPFITYRYGQNLALGNGLVFNPGERLLGSSAPGHMLLSAFVYAVFGQETTPSVMSVVGCLGWSAQAFAAYFLLRPVTGRLRALMVALGLQLGAACSFAWVPFETNLVSACVVWAFVALQVERWMWVALLSGLATLLRPDALLAACVLGAACLWKRRAHALGPVALFLAMLAPWLIFATLYYGSPLPQSAVTKFHRADLASYLEHMGQVVAQTVVPFADGAPLLVLGWTLLVFGAGLLLRRDRVLGLYALYVVLHGAVYLYLRPFIGHDWHLYPLQLGGSVLALGGLAAFSSQPAPRWLRPLASAALVLLLLLTCARTAFVAATHRDDYWSGARDDVYKRLARVLGQRAKPGEAFASVEVGTLAYYTHLRVYDMGGLVTDTAHVSRDGAVRWLVLDANYTWMAPPWPPVYAVEDRVFSAFLYQVPDGKVLTFPNIGARPIEQRR